MMELDHTQPQQLGLEPGRQQEAREYARMRRRLSFVSLAIGVVGVIILIITNLDTWLHDILRPLAWQPFPGWFPWQILVYFLILMLGYQLITTPLSYFGGFLLPHRYWLSTMRLKGWASDLLKGIVLRLILAILVVE